MSFVIGLRWGIMGVATSYSIMWALLMVPSFLIPFRLVELSGWTFLRALWPTIWMSLVMTAACGAWRFLLYRLGVGNPFVDLFSTVLLGVAVYVGLVLWRKPMVLGELASVLEGTSYGAVRSLGRRLPRPAINRFAATEIDSLTSAER
jgi:PST family polysaccharide transporter